MNKIDKLTDDVNKLMDKTIPLGIVGDVLCGGKDGSTVWKENIPSLPDFTPQFEGGIFFNSEELYK